MTALTSQGILPLDQRFLSPRLLQQAGPMPTRERGNSGRLRGTQGWALQGQGSRQSQLLLVPAVFSGCRCVGDPPPLWGLAAWTHLCALLLGPGSPALPKNSLFDFYFFIFSHPLPNKLFLGILSQAVNLLQGALNYSYPLK